jgi:hypothetical protein
LRKEDYQLKKVGKNVEEEGWIADYVTGGRKKNGFVPFPIQLECQPRERLTIERKTS